MATPVLCAECQRLIGYDGGYNYLPSITCEDCHLALLDAATPEVGDYGVVLPGTEPLPARAVSTEETG